MRLALALAATLLTGSALGQHAPRSLRAASHARGESPVVEVIHRIDERLRETRYSHVTRVVEPQGRFDFDCSGMAAWVLARSTPHAHATVMRRNGHGRPVAANYHDVIADAPSDRERGGWMRLTRVDALRPGDVIAWRRPPAVASSNTGHVAFVIATPRRLDRAGRRYIVRVVDSTSIPHGDDTRPRAHRSGFGYGNLTLHLDDPRGEVIAYGWYGLSTRVDFRTHIALGRAVR